MRKRNIFYAVAALALAATAADFAKHICLAVPEKPVSQKGGSTAVETERYGLGRPATPADFVKHEYLVGPKGTGLPKGRGTAREGRAVYLQAASCVTGCAAKERTIIRHSLAAKTRLKATNRCQQSGATGPTPQRYGIM